MSGPVSGAPAPTTTAAVPAAASDLARSLRRALLFLGAAVVIGGGLLLAVLLDGGAEPRWAFFLYTASCWVWTAAGIFAWWRRPSNRLGALLVWGGVGLTLSEAASSAIPELMMVGIVFTTAPLAVVVHLLHAFPSGRLRGRASRLTVAGGYLVTFVLQMPLYVFDARMAGTPLFVADRPDLLTLGREVQQIAGALVMVATTVILAARLRRARPAQRRVLVPLFGYGILAVLWIPLSSALLTPWLGLDPVFLAVSQILVVGGIPVAFVLAVFRGGFARTGELQELSTWLGSRDDYRSELAGALGSVLGDPNLELVFWVPGEQRHVDAAGRPVPLPGPGSDRSAVSVELAGEPIGAIVYDAGLIADPELVRAAGRVVALGVERERLTAALRVTEQSLRRSRERIVETADSERRRIAQDLHDGLQVKLVLLALEAQQAARDMDPGSAVRARVTELRHGIDAAAAELRALVHAVMPSALVERGLAMATEDLLDRLPLRSTLEVVDVGPLPRSVQSTAYFVVAEAVANVVKHAGAGRVRVSVEQLDGVLTVDVEDDGVGGAAIDRGTGIRGLLDRVDVLGGDLLLSSPPGAGTRLAVRLPTAHDAALPSRAVRDASPSDPDLEPARGSARQSAVADR